MTSVLPENLLENKELFRNTIKDVKEQLNKEIVDNPKFEELLYNELLFFVRKTLKNDFDVVVSDDKNSVSITSYSPIVGCSVPQLNDKNKAFLRSVIYLKDTNLVCEYNQGILLDRKSLEDSGIRVSLSYESKLETYYSCRFFNKDGVEYSSNSYSDVYPFSDDADDIDLMERTMSSFHKPIFNEYKLPTIPIHVIRANTRNTYRKEDSLAVIHANVATATRDGYKDVNCGLYTNHSLLPEMLRGEKLFAKSSGNNVVGYKFSLVDDYANSFEEAYKKANDNFKKSIENSDLKNYNNKAYEYFMEKLK